MKLPSSGQTTRSRLFSPPQNQNESTGLHLHAPASLRGGEDEVHGILSGVLDLDLQREAGVHLQHGLQQVHYACKATRLSLPYTKQNRA